MSWNLTKMQPCKGKVKWGEVQTKAHLNTKLFYIRCPCGRFTHSNSWFWVGELYSAEKDTFRDKSQNAHFCSVQTALHRKRVAVRREQIVGKCDHMDYLFSFCYIISIFIRCQGLTVISSLVCVIALKLMLVNRPVFYRGLPYEIC